MHQHWCTWVHQCFRSFNIRLPRSCDPVGIDHILSCIPGVTIHWLAFFNESHLVFFFCSVYNGCNFPTFSSSCNTNFSQDPVEQVPCKSLTTFFSWLTKSLPALTSTLSYQFLVFDGLPSDVTPRALLIPTWLPVWLHPRRWPCLNKILFVWCNQGISTIFQDPLSVASLEMRIIYIYIYIYIYAFQKIDYLVDRGINTSTCSFFHINT